jgi:hypothetical protein
MRIRRLGFKSVFFAWIICALVFSFPLQVVLKTPLPSLLPYALMSSFIILYLGGFRAGGRSDSIHSSQISKLDIMLGVYFFVVTLHLIVQYTFLSVSLTEIVAAVVNYLFPISFYICFRKEGSTIIIQRMFTVIALMGFVIGLHFIYDTYLKIGVGQVSAYTKKSFEYTLLRHNLSEFDEGVNRYYMMAGTRSIGLLATQAISGAWVVLGFIGAFAAIPRRNRALHNLAKLAYGLMIAISMNFTNILAFCVVLVFGCGEKLTYARIYSFIRKSLWVAVCLGTFGGIFVYIMLASKLGDRVISSLGSHFSFLLGHNEEKHSFVELTVQRIYFMLDYFTDNLSTLLLGDGFTSYGLRKGGDIAWLETLTKFGFPLYALFLSSLVYLLVSHVKKLHSSMSLNKEDECKRNMVQFAISVVMLVLVNEGHYGVWYAKPILPIFFFALALLNQQGRAQQSQYRTRGF